MLTIQRSSSKHQHLKWTHDKDTPRRSEASGIEERYVRRVEGTATAMVHLGLPDEWWHCAMEYY